MEFTKFDKLFAISDLHMGGKPSFQILRETERLENFILWVDKEHSDEHMPSQRKTLLTVELLQLGK